jgi:hypothetical protein
MSVEMPSTGVVLANWAVRCISHAPHAVPIVPKRAGIYCIDIVYAGDSVPVNSSQYRCLGMFPRQCLVLDFCLSNAVGPPSVLQPSSFGIATDDERPTTLFSTPHKAETEMRKGAPHSERSEALGMYTE